jgi:chemotaxis protein CheC
MLLGEDSLGGVLSAMLGRPLIAGAPLSDEALSAIKELGNIICSNYLNAIADLVGFPILPSVPALAIDMASSILESVAADAAQSGAQALLLENRFKDWGQPVPIYVFYLPEAGALEALFAGLARSTGVDPRGGRA